MINRIHNSSNPYQGGFKRVLCVCSAGLLRSPTAALVLSQEPFNFNTRSCGIDSGHALIVLDEVLVKWADEIVVMSREMAERILTSYNYDKHVVDLDIPDNFRYRDPELMMLIAKHYQDSLIMEKAVVKN